MLGSLSRLMDRVVSPRHKALAARARDLLATWAENEELIRLGAYRKGTSAAVDEAIERMPHVDAFLRQRNEVATFEQDLAALAKAVGAK